MIKKIYIILSMILIGVIVESLALLLQSRHEEILFLSPGHPPNAANGQRLRAYVIVLTISIVAVLCFTLYLILYNFNRRKKAEKDLRESENRFDLLIKQVTDYAIYMIDPTGRVMSWNQGAQFIKGYRAEEVIGKPFSMFYTDEEIARGEPAFNLKKAAEEGRYECIGLRRRKDGSFFYADVVFTAMHDEKGQVSGYIKITKDITRQIEAQEEMQRALDRERELNEMKSKFVTLASHEFKTPLSVILSSTNLIEKYSAPDQQPDRLRHIHRIKSNVNNLKQLLNDFLSVEKLEEGIIMNNPSPSDLEKIAQEAILDMAGTCKDGQWVYLQVTGVPRIVDVDPHLLRNILDNLLSNAMKYSPENSQISLHLFFEDQAVRLAIADPGIGIPAEEREQLFERFFRAGNTTGIPGSGLGLSIVKNYLHLMCGTITVDSQPDKGSVFTVTLPAVL